MKRTTLVLVLLLLVGPVALSAADTRPEAGPVLRMGCVAYAKAATADAYKQVRDYLAKELGQDIALTVYPDYHEVVHDVVNDKLDVAILSPLVYLNAQAERPLHALAYAISRGSGHFTYHSQILVRKDAPEEKLADLAGKKMAFVDLMSASGYVVPKEALVKAGVTGKKNVVATFCKNHHDAVMSVVEGKCDAAATYDQIFIDSKKLGEVKDKLKVLWTSESVIPADAFVATESVPAAQRKRIRSALLAYCVAQDKKACPENGMYEGFVPGDPNLYNDMKRFLERVKVR